MTARADFEYAVWQITGSRLTRGHMDAILCAADAYALAEYGVTADRRAELAAVKRLPPLDVAHYWRRTGSACGHSGGNLLRATDPAAVTCENCKRTNAWKDAS